jgi:hypothetical protein
MSKVAVLIKNPAQQYEGLRSSLGMLLYNTEVRMFVLNDEIANMDEAYEDRTRPMRITWDFSMRWRANGSQTIRPM